MGSTACETTESNATMRMGQVFLAVIVGLMAYRPCNGQSSSSWTSSSAATSSAIEAEDGCPEMWTLVGDQCLLPLMSPEIWQDAVDTCAAEGGALFSPESHESMTYVRGLITPSCDGFWLGCIDRMPANGQFVCPGQDGVYWNNETDYHGYWNWTRLPDILGKSTDEYCTLTYGTIYWIEGFCYYPGICPVCTRNREPVTTMVPPSTLSSDPAPHARHRSVIYKASASELGCLSNRYGFLIFAAPSHIRCAAMCLAHQDCASFNFYQRKKQNCQLNTSRIGSVPADEVTHNTACTYYE